MSKIFKYHLIFHLCNLFADRSLRITSDISKTKGFSTHTHIPSCCYNRRAQSPSEIGRWTKIDYRNVAHSEFFHFNIKTFQPPKSKNLSFFFSFCWLLLKSFLFRFEIICWHPTENNNQQTKKRIFRKPARHDEAAAGFTIEQSRRWSSDVRERLQLWECKFLKKY